jgi:hypothetical protein
VIQQPVLPPNGIEIASSRRFYRLFSGCFFTDGDVQPNATAYARARGACLLGDTDHAGLATSGMTLSAYSGPDLRFTPRTHVGLAREPGRMARPNFQDNPRFLGARQKFAERGSCPRRNVPRFGQLRTKPSEVI